MALTKTTELYEILFRFEDGAVKGAQCQYLEKIFEDGTLKFEQIANAQKVSVLDGDATGLALAGILSETVISQQKTIDTRDETIVQKDGEISTLNTEIATLKTRV